MADAFRLIVLGATVTYMLVLGMACIFLPTLARRFLSGFASTVRVHFAELGARTLVGFALLEHASISAYAKEFSMVGWLLLSTTAILLLIPWRLHRRFAMHVLPSVLRFVQPIGLAALLMGLALLIGIRS
jgi:hypothetical protein